ncbi:hypothetical protein ACEQ8H_007999 [Pleosporales sp. CAS-2024a]
MTQLLPHLTDFNPGMWYRLELKNSHLPATHCLDIINDKSDQSIGLLTIARDGFYSGQYWQITTIGDGIYSLRTLWLGPHRPLDVRSDGMPVL